MLPFSLSSVWPDFPCWFSCPQHRHLPSPWAKGHGVCAALDSLPSGPPSSHEWLYPQASLSLYRGCQWAPRHVEPLPPAQRVHLPGCATLLPVVCSWGLLQKAPWDYRNSLLLVPGGLYHPRLAHRQGVTRAEGGKPSSLLSNETNSGAVQVLQSARWGEPGAGLHWKLPLTCLFSFSDMLPPHLLVSAESNSMGSPSPWTLAWTARPRTAPLQCPPFHSWKPPPWFMSCRGSTWITISAPDSSRSRLFHVTLSVPLSTAVPCSKGSDHCSSAVGPRTNSAWSLEPPHHDSNPSVMNLADELLPLYATRHGHSPTALSPPPPLLRAVLSP